MEVQHFKPRLGSTIFFLSFGTLMLRRRKQKKVVLMEKHQAHKYFLKERVWKQVSLILHGGVNI